MTSNTIQANDEQTHDTSKPAQPGGCCGGPAPTDSGACCALDAEVKSTGGAGCGCGPSPAPSDMAPAPRKGCC